MWVPGKGKEKLFAGWTGWNEEDYGLTTHMGTFIRGVFAEKQGGSADCIHVHVDSVEGV